MFRDWALFSYVTPAQPLSSEGPSKIENDETLFPMHNNNPDKIGHQTMLIVKATHGDMENLRCTPGSLMMG
jgi:hypothetical protein